MTVVDQPLLDELRRLAAFVSAARSGRDLLFVNRLTLAYLHAESGAQGESRSELRAAEEVAPEWLRGCVRALVDGVRALPAEAAAALPRGWTRARGRSSSRRAGSGARTASTPAQPLLALATPMAAG